jgi:hypothetical protein
LSKQARSAALVFLLEGKLELSRLLADFAGDDQLLVFTLICDCWNWSEDSISPNSDMAKTSGTWNINKLVSRKMDFKTIFDDLMDSDNSNHLPLSPIQSLLSTLLNLIQESENNFDTASSNVKFIELNLKFEQLLRSIYPSHLSHLLVSSHLNESPLSFVRVITNKSVCGCYDRRSSLHVLNSDVKNHLDDCPLLVLRNNLKSGVVSNKQNIQQGKDHVTLQENHLDSSIKDNFSFIKDKVTLALDIIEGWLCIRTYPEFITTDSNNFGTTTAKPPRITTNQTITGSNTGHSITSKPITWIDGVGQGKDWEKVTYESFVVVIIIVMFYNSM